MVHIITTIIIFVLFYGACVDAQAEAPEVTNFRNYLRIPTVVQDEGPGYQLATEWLQDQAAQLGLDFHVFDLGPDADFALWMTWNGTDPSLKSVLFHSHLDVVPVVESVWSHPPFEAYKDSDGNIFARGASDMKIATVATFEAVRRLKQEGFQPLRNIHIMVNPDEEKGGRRAIRPFLLTPEFKQLNVGIDIDEGGVNAGDVINVRYTEKLAWHFNITARGKAGHGSTLPEYTAGQRLQYAMNKVFEFRDEQFRKLQTPGITADDLTVVNLAQMGGGLAENIIASEVWAVFDCRIRVTPQWNWTDVENMLNNIAEESRLGSLDDPENQVTISYVAKNLEHGETAVDDSNIWWGVVQNACAEMNVTCQPSVSNGATDGRFLRNIGIPVFGLGPFLNTPSTAHQDNEFVNEAEFLNGIPRYQALFRHLANTPKSDIDQ